MHFILFDLLKLYRTHETSSVLMINIQISNEAELYTFKSCVLFKKAKTCKNSVLLMTVLNVLYRRISRATYS